VKWLKERLSERFEIKTKVIGAGPGEETEARILNRIIRVTDKGWQYEPDQRHADPMVRELGLEKAKGVKSPGEDEKKWEMEDNEKPLSPGDATRFRAIAARANYLALDRVDLQYAAKEVCRGLAAPTVGHSKKLRRLGRCLIDARRVVSDYKLQVECRELATYSDSDWAGCRRTAKSTSGGPSCAVVTC